ncbi:carboxylesterase family protein [Nonomuraea sp. NPDC005983]|uniref:carboxylesterase/lipase family protein n=1 Tax=Nonomuraea sp. NPDC005983 TaxID=3155595 RepID=UPI0033B9150B
MMRGSAPVVSVQHGLLRGVADRGTFFFGGVPYATAPVGPHRFRPPAPPARWDGERPALTPGPAAPQVRCYGVIGQVFGTVLPQGEDCLSLTVRTPELGRAGLPVLVWLHGGGFALGSGGEPLYQGGAFARDGVVEVSVTHRLGVDGYAVLDDPAGRVVNLGLQDQLAALTWVVDNIERFGGDPARITLAGQSAGGMAVACLLSSPRAAGLIHRAIIQSPTAPLAVPHGTASRITDQLAELLGIPGHDVAALDGVPREKLLDAQGMLCDEAFVSRDAGRFGEAAAAGMAFMPVIDGDLLPEDPLTALAAGAARGVSLLVGSNREETLLMLSDGQALNELGLPEAVLAAYRGRRPGASDLELAIEITTDAGFRLPAQAVADAQTPHAEVFTYLFDKPGARHGDELPYTFGAAESDLAAAVHGAWVSFITHGRPEHPALPTDLLFPGGTT